MERKILIAPDGMILTDGTIYGTIIYLEVGRDESDFKVITIEEYERSQAQKEDVYEGD